MIAQQPFTVLINRQDDYKAQRRQVQSCIFCLLPMQLLVMRLAGNCKDQHVLVLFGELGREAQSCLLRRAKVGPRRGHIEFGCAYLIMGNAWKNLLSLGTNVGEGDCGVECNLAACTEEVVWSQGKDTEQGHRALR